MEEITVEQVIFFVAAIGTPPLLIFFLWLWNPSKITRQQKENQLFEYQARIEFLEKELDKTIGIPMLPPSDEGERIPRTIPTDMPPSDEGGLVQKTQE